MLYLCVGFSHLLLQANLASRPHVSKNVDIMPLLHTSEAMFPLWSMVPLFRSEACHCLSRTTTNRTLYDHLEVRVVCSLALTRAEVKSKHAGALATSALSMELPAVCQRLWRCLSTGKHFTETM
jgi:hypothetical protein